MKKTVRVLCSAYLDVEIPADVPNDDVVDIVKAALAKWLEEEDADTVADAMFDSFTVKS